MRHADPSEARSIGVIRHLFIISSGLSLLLSIATLAMWVRSFTSPFGRTIDGNTLHNGSIETESDWAWIIYSSDGLLDINLVGSFYEWKVRYWEVFLLLLALPARWVQLRLRARRARSQIDLCGKCGYDLRASEERCPEYGIPIAFGLPPHGKIR
jgi:hypothetical protein